jgi:hypothetical protein
MEPHDTASTHVAVPVAAVLSNASAVLRLPPPPSLPLQSFDEFVVALWNYCTLDRSALLLFAFDMCDLDNTGEIGGCDCLPPSLPLPALPSGCPALPRLRVCPCHPLPAHPPPMSLSQTDLRWPKSCWR